MLIDELPEFNAIKIGPLYYKSRNIEESFTKSCRMMFFESRDGTLPLGRGGSATLVRFRDVNYVVATRHQLKIAPGAAPPIDILDTIRVSSGEGTLSNIPLKSVRFETSNPDEEFHDLLLFETADEWGYRQRDRPYFFNLARFSKRPRVKSFVVGYPSLDVVMAEYLEGFVPEQSGTIHIKRAICDCELDPNFETHVRHFRRYKFSREQIVVDGYSGGAVFSLVGELGDLEIVLDGIIVRAGRNYVHIVDADYLMNVIGAF